jgi:hypothetical protein
VLKSNPGAIHHAEVDERADHGELSRDSRLLLLAPGLHEPDQAPGLTARLKMEGSRLESSGRRNAGVVGSGQDRFTRKACRS